LPTVLHAQLANDIPDVTLDRIFSQMEAIADFAVGQAPGKERQHLLFTPGQVFNKRFIGGWIMVMHDSYPLDRT
jgi:hypothetical protein